jgi:hypothetical protein
MSLSVRVEEEDDDERGGLFLILGSGKGSSQ